MSSAKAGAARLAHYQRALSDANAPVGQEITIEVAVTPGDEISEIKVRISAAVMAGRAGKGPVMTLATRRSSAGETFAPAVTRLEGLGAVENVTYRRIADGPRGSCVCIECPPPEAGKDLTLSLLAWEMVTPLDGDSPYVRGALEAVIGFPGLPDVPILLTVVTPKDMTPRSIQGNHVLAYPSRTYREERHLNLHFQGEQPLRLRADFGPTNEVVDVWIGFAKLAAAMALIALVTSLAKTTDNTGRLLSVLTSLIALVTVAGAIVRQLTELRIYHRVRRRLQGTLLAAQLIGIAVVAASLLRLRERNPGGLYGVVEPTAIALVVLTGIAALAGLVLHRLGVWHHFTCDFEGCTNVLRRRLGRPECRYTGRVFCDDHQREVCAPCVHGPDLWSSEPATAGAFDHRALPCRKSTDDA